MATRQEEKQRLREHRLAGQREDERRARTRMIGGYAVAGVLAAAVVTAVVVVVASLGGSSSAAANGGPLGQHYVGLQGREAAAKVPSMMDTMGSSSHFHPHLTVYMNGKRVAIPANIGINPSQPAMQMASLHTHDSSGTIHDEGMPSSRLGQFFAVWGVPFSPKALGPNRTTGSKTVRMWVDGKRSNAFGNLPLRDGQQIVVSYGDKGAPPPPLG
jgi:hypothetical protein